TWVATSARDAADRISYGLWPGVSSDGVFIPAAGFYGSVRRLLRSRIRFSARPSPPTAVRLPTGAARLLPVPVALPPGAPGDAAASAWRPAAGRRRGIRPPYVLPKNALRNRPGSAVGSGAPPARRPRRLLPANRR